MYKLDSNFLNYILGGNSEFTVLNKNTNNRLTFKVKKLKKEDTKAGREDLWFVNVLSGPNNERNYIYIGTIVKERFIHTKGSKVKEDSVSFRAFKWIYDYLKVYGDLPDFIEIYHVGKCAKCGRKLTTPDSISEGMGPVCAKF